jgi:hypothetical protein
MILNLTQHAATPEQVLAGVVDLSAEMRAKLSDILTFRMSPDLASIDSRAAMLAQIADGDSLSIPVAPFKSAMIGGAPFLMSALEHQLKMRGIAPLYAFSQRVSSEVTNADGSVTKLNEFKHIGFVDLG